MQCRLMQKNEYSYCFPKATHIPMDTPKDRQFFSVIWAVQGDCEIVLGSWSQLMDNQYL